LRQHDSVDSTFIRGHEESERHLEVRVGNVETADGGRQVFGTVTRADTDISALIRRTLEAVARKDATKVTAFTDGCPGLRTILADVGVTQRPISGLVSYRDAFATHEIGGGEFVDRPA
jgi:hypothetical protein